MAGLMAQAARHVPGLEVASVLSRSAARARDFAAGIGAVGTDDADLFHAQIDAVYIATEAAHHEAAITAALAARTPVLCEKPLTPSAETTARLLDLSATTGVALMEGIWTLCLPAYRAVMDTIPERPCRLTFDFSHPLPDGAGAHYTDPATGGVLLDRAVYGLAPAISLLGPVASQTAKVHRDTRGCDRSAELLLTHERGGVSVITISFDHLGANRLDLAGPASTFMLGPPSLAAERLLRARTLTGPATSGGSGLKDRLKSAPVLRRIKQSLDAVRVPSLGYGRSQYAPMLAEFYRLVGSGQLETPLVPHDLSREIARLVAEARAR